MFYYVLRYNLGSMAFGSLILAVVEVLVWLLEVIDEQTKADQQTLTLTRALTLTLTLTLTRRTSRVTP